MFWIREDISLVEDAFAAEWVKERLLPFSREAGIRVGNVVPQGFEANARIFHPASRYLPDTQEWEPVRWSEIASWTGRAVHPGMQFHAILGNPEDPNAKPDWGHLPREGTLDADQILPVVEILVKHTATPQRCHFCVWDGWGGIDDPRSLAILGPGTPGTDRLAERVRNAQSRASRAKRIEIGLFTYLVFVGGLEAVADDEESPSIWWPEDRAWCVATDVDMSSTLVGGSTECIDELINHPALEALPIEIDTRIDVYGDTLNR